MYWEECPAPSIICLFLKSTEMRTYHYLEAISRRYRSELGGDAVNAGSAARLNVAGVNLSAKLDLRCRAPSSVTDKAESYWTKTE